MTLWIEHLHSQGPRDIFFLPSRYQITLPREQNPPSQSWNGELLYELLHGHLLVNKNYATESELESAASTLKEIDGHATICLRIPDIGQFTFTHVNSIGYLHDKRAPFFPDETK